MKSNRKLIILILLLTTMPVCFGKNQYTALKESDILSAMKKVADWQIRNFKLAYGINQGLLDGKTYMPVLEKSWKSLVSAINKDGKLGWVQPVGADPKKSNGRYDSSLWRRCFLACRYRDLFLHQQ